MRRPKKTESKQPSFNTLTGVMERFAQVPYEQFQQEIHDWFYNSLTEKGIDVQQLQEQSLLGLPNLISFIYHDAEVKQLLHDRSIPNEPSND